MDISNKLIAPIAIQDNQNRVVSVNLAALITRLLLFDTYIVHSVWLQDLILLQHSFGTAGLAQLFEAGALKFQCAGFTFGQTGQMYGQQSLPFFNYEFSVIRVQDAEEKLERTLATLDSALREELTKGRLLVPPDYSKSLFETFYSDIRGNLLNSAINIELRRNGIVPVSHYLQVRQTKEDQFAVDNDLRRRYRLPGADAHRIIQSAMMAVGGLNDRIISMQTYSALTGLTETHKALLDSKIRGIVGLISSEVNEAQFSRVASLKGLPVPVYGSTVVDVKALLKIRESDECKSFKAWLSGAEHLPDKELRERVTGLGRRIRQGVHSKVGKAVRLLVSTGLGLLHPPFGPVAGFTLSAVDSFLLERLLPRDAVVGFLSDAYPSLFKQP